MAKPRQPKPSKRTSQAQPAADARLQKALAALDAKRFEEARVQLRQVLNSNPNDGNAHNLMGITCNELGHQETALTHLEKAARAQPKNPFFAFNLGHALKKAGRHEAAITAFKKAARLKLDFADAHVQLGDCLRVLGKLKDAGDAYQHALSIQPNLLPALHGLGLVNLQSNVPEAAVQQFSLALKQIPEGATQQRANIQANLGLALYNLGRQPDAITHLVDAFEAAPANTRYRNALVSTLRHTISVPEIPKLTTVLLSLLEHAEVNPRSLDTAVQACLRSPQAVADLLEALSRDPDAPLTEINEYENALKDLLANPLFMTFLRSAPVTDTDIEILVSRLRRALLEAFMQPESEVHNQVQAWVPDTTALTIALAQQGWLNEYVAYISEAEQTMVDQLKLDIAEAITPDASYWARIALIACYGPIEATEINQSGAEMPESLAPVFKAHIENARKEDALKADLTTFKPMQDEVSLAVRDQYEQHPYPRWTRFDIGEPMSLAEVVRADLPYIAAAECPQTESPRVLIAGCGTGLQTMKAATRYRNASICAIDLSRASLAYGMRQLQEHGIDRVEHLHADILDLEAMDEQFDLVESYGVIHHMDDTAHALQLLADRTKPGGIMYLGLYSEIGRQSIVEVRNLIAKRGYASDDSGIRQARRDIMREQPAALRQLLSPASDFWTLSDTRDLIFHVHEHRFTLPEIDAMATACGLKFLGLVLRNPADRQAFDREFPEKNAARDVSNWHAFEQRHPETFGDTYKIWLKKR